MLSAYECFGSYDQLTPENLTAAALPDSVSLELAKELYAGKTAMPRSYDLARSLFLFDDDDEEYSEMTDVPFETFRQVAPPHGGEVRAPTPR